MVQNVIRLVVELLDGYHPVFNCRDDDKKDNWQFYQEVMSQDIDILRQTMFNFAHAADEGNLIQAWKVHLIGDKLIKHRLFYDQVKLESFFAGYLVVWLNFVHDHLTDESSKKLFKQPHLFANSKYNYQTIE